MAQAEKQVASTLCEQYILDGSVVPISLKNSTFTVHAIDNINVAGRSISGSGEMHGTSITASQKQVINQPKF